MQCPSHVNIEHEVSPEIKQWYRFFFILTDQLPKQIKKKILCLYGVIVGIIIKEKGFVGFHTNKVINEATVAKCFHASWPGHICYNVIPLDFLEIT